MTGPAKQTAATSAAARASSKRRSAAAPSNRMPVEMDRDQLRMKKVLLERELQLLHEAERAHENEEASRKG